MHRRAWSVITPGVDMFVEELNDEEGFAAADEGGTPPRGLRGHCHRFTKPMRDHIMGHVFALGGGPPKLGAPLIEVLDSAHNWNGDIIGPSSVGVSRRLDPSYVFPLARPRATRGPRGLTQVRRKVVGESAAPSGVWRTSEPSLAAALGQMASLAADDPWAASRRIGKLERPDGTVHQVTLEWVIDALREIPGPIVLRRGGGVGQRRGRHAHSRRHV